MRGDISLCLRAISIQLTSMQNEELWSNKGQIGGLIEGWSPDYCA